MSPCTVLEFCLDLEFLVDYETDIGLEGLVPGQADRDLTCSGGDQQCSTNSIKLSHVATNTPSTKTAALPGSTDNLTSAVTGAGATKVEKTSGVWIDGQYMGYLKELEGSKKILLLPGEHEIVVRQGGYKDFPKKSWFNPVGNK